VLVMSSQISMIDNFKTTGVETEEDENNDINLETDDNRPDIGDVDPIARLAAMETYSNDIDDNQSKCQVFYLSNNNCKKVLYAMAVGLQNDMETDVFVNFDDEVYIHATIKKKEYIPELKQLKKEILRRAECNKNIDKIPRPSQWSAMQIQTWLECNPITEEVDVIFIKTEINKFVSLLKLTIKEIKENDNNCVLPTISWNTEIPMLRLIHVFMEEDIKILFHLRNDPMNRSELDGRNSVDAPITFYKAAADRWNDPDFCAESIVCGNTHSDYIASKNLNHDMVKKFTITTPKKVKEKLAVLRSKLITIIGKWTASGNGTGMYDSNVTINNSDDDSSNNNYVNTCCKKQLGDIAHLRVNTIPDYQSDMGNADDRKLFLGSEAPYILYFWDVAYEHDLLRSTLQKIDEAFAARTASSAPSVIQINKKRKSMNSSNSLQSIDTKFTEHLETMNSTGIALSKSLESSKEQFAIIIRQHKHASIIAQISEKQRYFDDRKTKVETLQDKLIEIYDDEDGYAKDQK
jgi:hypothetical protein